MATIIVEHRFAERASEDELSRAARAIDAELASRGGRWERSYLSGDGTRMICELSATSADAVREAYDAAKVAYEAIWRAERSRVEDIAPSDEPVAFAPT